VNIRIPSASAAVRAAVAAVLGSALLIPSMAYAAEEQKKEEAKEAELEEITVTGSRIVRRDLESNSPTVTVEGAAFSNRANLSVESALNELPQFAASLGFGGAGGDTFRNSQQGATANQFTPGGIANSALDPLNTYNANNTVGATSVSLRGLGSNRTLLLMNGRRLVPVNASLAVDTSSIPSSALQRVEIVTGGASSVYGADAVSGVVNFILKDNYEGAELDLQYGITELGDNQNLRLSGILGGNFGDGRGNAFVGMEYSQRGVAWNADRGYNKERYRNPLIAAGGNLYLMQYEPTTAAVQGTPVANPSAAVMDAIYRSHNASYVNGTVPVNSPILVNPNGTIFVANDPEGALGAQLNDGYEYKINNLSGTWGYNNLKSRLSSPSTRYSLFSSAHFDFTDDLRFYTQATFAHNHSEFISTPGLGQFTTYIALNRQSPVPTELGRLLDSRLTPAAGPNPAVSRANDPYTVSFPIAALFPEAGSKSDAMNFQFINGFSGNLPVKDWTFDVFNSYGKSRNVTTGINAVSVQALRLLAGLPNYGAMAGGDANRDGKSDGYFNGPGTGDLVDAPSNAVYPHAYLKCTSGLGPALYPSLYPGQSVSADCLDSLTANPVGVTEMMQDQVEGAIQGGLFELPAGDLRFALGGGWRVHRYDFDPSDMISTTNIFDVQANTHPTNPAHASDSVTEGFAELLVPVLKDVPFFKHLNVELGYRYSDYKYAGPVSTWKALADWAITPGLRLRGGFQRANRAPNLVELFDPGSSAVQVGPGDPCSASFTNSFGLAGARYSANPTFNPQNAAKVRALCRYQMGAAGADSYYTRDTQNAAFGGNLFGLFLVGVNAVGNPHLKNEKSDTWTVGTVLRSPFEHPLARFTATVDWFRIKVDDAIFIPLLTTLSGSPLQGCWDANVNPALATLKGDGTDSADALAAADAPLACRLVQRNPSDGTILTNRDTPYNNVGSIVSEGVDFGLNWSASLADLGLKLPGRISFGANASYMLTDKRQSISGAQYEDFTGVAGRGGVRWSFTNTLGYFNGPLNASLNWRHYPSLTSLGRLQGTDLRQEGIDPYDILDLSFGYSLSRNLSMRFGVQNLLDVDPPISGRNPGNPNILTARGFPTGKSEGSIATGVYDALGRSYFAGFKLSF
jgi:outer membrane receptor protein involved in Fe transport